MPCYEFLCEICGTFDVWCSLQQRQESVICPTCHTVAQRCYSMPALIKTPSPLSKALLQAEKSITEPAIVRRHTPSQDRQSDKKLHKKQHGRPWQISHS